ncbi:MAG: glycoside hydrolase family 28 protein [bacterium]|nr:glycoside hydrolase family 28 protein [bacterium]
MIKNKKILIIFAISILLFLGLVFFLKNRKWNNDSNNGKIPFDMPAISLSEFPDNTCDIKNYGAIGDGNFINTQSIKNAVEDCYQKGGGEIIFPKGKWLTGPIHLKSNINLHLEKDSEIIFTANLDDYLPVVFSKFQGMEYYNFSPPIYANGAENIALTGSGKIFGNGNFWEKWASIDNSEIQREKLFQMSKAGIPAEERIFGQKDSGLRPSFIQFVNCKNIFIEGLTIENGPMWTIHPIYSENIIIKNVNIYTYSMNTDGVAIDSSKNVLIEDSNFSTGDDAIAIKSGLEDEGIRINRPSENIVIRNSNFSESHGSVAIGSEMSGGVRNVLVENSIFSNSGSGLRIKSTSSRGGFVENIWLNNVKMHNIEGEAIVFNLRYESALKTRNAEASRTPIIKNIYIKNVSGNSMDKAIGIFGLKDGIMENIFFKNIELQSKNKSDLKYARNIEFENVSLKIDKDEPVFSIESSKDIKFKNFKCENYGGICFDVKGRSTSNINFKEAGIRKERIHIEDGIENNVELVGFFGNILNFFIY